MCYDPDELPRNASDEPSSFDRGGSVYDPDVIPGRADQFTDTAVPAFFAPLPLATPADPTSRKQFDPLLYQPFSSFEELFEAIKAKHTDVLFRLANCGPEARCWTGWDRGGVHLL